MPWRETSAMNERFNFVVDAQRGHFPFAELCRRYGVSRKTGYKWLHRFEQHGPQGLADRSHRPHSCPHATPLEVVQAILELRRRRGWGCYRCRRQAPSVALSPPDDPGASKLPPLGIHAAELRRGPRAASPVRGRVHQVREL